MDTGTLTALKILGPGIAKAILDSCGLDNKVANKVLEQAIDVGSGQLLDGAVDKATLEQQIQKLAKEFQKDIQPFLKHEARNIDKDGQTAIFLAVAETILQGGMNLKLVDVALDAERLTEELLKADIDGTKWLSADEKAFYKQAIAFTSERLILMAPQLEGFQLSMNRAMLERTAELVAFVRSQKEQELQKRDRFLSRYREAVQNVLNKPDTFGMRILKDTLSQQKLCEAYVQLSITETGEEIDDADQIDTNQAISDFEKALLRLVRERKSQNLEEVLARRRRLVIRGNAGAGKTSLMQWLAIHATQQDFEAPLQNWNCLIPFFIRLRSRVDDGFPVPKDFVQPIAKNIADTMPEGWVQEQLDRGCALVLIDGVDELPRDKRQPFFEALQQLVADFPDAVYITTSRPAGLKDENGEEWTEWEDWMRAEKFSNCVMEPMNLLEIEQFVKRWHEALPPSSQNENKDPDQTAQDLMRQIRQTPEIRQLASTPLLCTIDLFKNRENVQVNRFPAPQGWILGILLP
jgi:NACHT domain